MPWSREPASHRPNRTGSLPRSPRPLPAFCTFSTQRPLNACGHPCACAPGRAEAGGGRGPGLHPVPTGRSWGALPLPGSRRVAASPRTPVRTPAHGVPAGIRGEVPVPQLGPGPTFIVSQPHTRRGPSSASTEVPAPHLGVTAHGGGSRRRPGPSAAGRGPERRSAAAGAGRAAGRCPCPGSARLPGSRASRISVSFRRHLGPYSPHSESRCRHPPPSAAARARGRCGGCLPFAGRGRAGGEGDGGDPAEAAAGAVVAPGRAGRAGRDGPAHREGAARSGVGGGRAGEAAEVPVPAAGGG